MKDREIAIRPVRLTNEEYGELRKICGMLDLSIAEYIARLIKESLKNGGKER